MRMLDLKMVFRKGVSQDLNSSMESVKTSELIMQEGTFLWVKVNKLEAKCFNTYKKSILGFSEGKRNDIRIANKL